MRLRAVSALQGGWEGWGSLWEGERVTRAKENVGLGECL